MPWYGAIALGDAYEGAATFLGLDQYRQFRRWVDRIADRPAVQRGRIVNRSSGEHPLRERHAAGDIDAALAATPVTEPAPG